MTFRFQPHDHCHMTLQSDALPTELRSPLPTRLPGRLKTYVINLIMNLRVKINGIQIRKTRSHETSEVLYDTTLKLFYEVTIS